MSAFLNSSTQRTLYLSDFSGKDDRERISRAIEQAGKFPGTKLIIEAGIYNISSERSIEIWDNVMHGRYGSCPEPVMFSPDFPYDRGLDLNGHNGTTIEGTGAVFMMDGFMEDVSVRNCKDVTIRGITIDNVKKPCTKAVVTAISEGKASVEFSDMIYSETPIVRSVIYSHKHQRFIPELCNFESLISIDGTQGTILLNGGFDEVSAGDEIYLCHTYHFRPSILIENAENTFIDNVTVHSHAGMGLTAFQSEDIHLNEFRVVPRHGDHFSTNTDATHFTSCRGVVRLENCRFEGQGDDGINVHTYYYTPIEHHKNTIKLKIVSPTWTHTQKMDFPFIGDVMELTDKMTLMPNGTYKVISVSCDEENRSCTVTFDKDLPESLDGQLLADPCATPVLEVIGCVFKNHFARGMTLKSRRCYISDCEMTDVFELPIKLAAEAYWHEGVSCDEMTVRNCRFINCGKIKYCVPRFECGGVEVFSDSRAHTQVHNKVLIENNYISCPDCKHAIILRDLHRAHLENNTLISAESTIIAENSVEMI